MNMGIQDAFNLAWKLGRVIRSAASPQLLDSYEVERKPIDEAVIRQTDRVTRLVSLHGSVTRFLRDHMMSWVAHFPGFEQKFGPALSGIATSYPKSPIVEEHSTGSQGPAAGERAPDAPLEKPDDGAALRLYDLIAAHRHVLLLLGGASDGSLAALPGHSAGNFSANRIASPGMAAGDLIGCQGTVAERFGSAPPPICCARMVTLGFAAVRKSFP
jgi:hypothetical protein